MATRLTEWKIEDELKTSEDRAHFLEAMLEDAVKERDCGLVISAVGAVIKSIEQERTHGRRRRTVRTSPMPVIA